MTIRLDPAARRKVKRLATREGISMNEAVNRLLHMAPDEPTDASRLKRYRLKPRKIGFGFEIAHAKQLAAQLADEQTREKLKTER